MDKKKKQRHNRRHPFRLEQGSSKACKNNKILVLKPDAHLSMNNKIVPSMFYEVQLSLEQYLQDLLILILLH